MSKIKCKRLCVMLTLSLLLVCMMGTTAFAAGTGDVAGAVESTWATASQTHHIIHEMSIIQSTHIRLHSTDRKSTRLNSSHMSESRMPSSA